jgi:hypothetical protein
VLQSEELLARLGVAVLTSLTGAAAVSLPGDEVAEIGQQVVAMSLRALLILLQELF